MYVKLELVIMLYETSLDSILVAGHDVKHFTSIASF